MTWTLILDILADLGAATADSLWLPVLAWTGLALPLWALLERIDRLHPLAEYRLSQALLFALPLGLVAAALRGLLPTPPPVDAVIEVPRAAIPAVEVAASQTVETTAREATNAPAWTWMQALGLLTVLGLVVGAVQLGRLALDALAVARVRALVKGTPSESIQSCVHRMAEQLDVGRPVRVCLVPSAVVPITLGGMRPTILLPPGLAEQDDALRMTLRHELIHIRRYDDLAHLAERFVAALFAAHPLVGRLRSRIEASRERACDAAVLSDRQTSSAAYARLLASFAEGNPRSGRLGALSLSESPSSLTDRLNAMRSTVPRWLSSPLSLGIILVALGLILTVGVAACTDTGMPSSSDATSTSAVLDSGESVWTPIEDALEVGDEWVSSLNKGEMERSYELAAPMVDSVQSVDWEAWVEQRRDILGAVQDRRLVGVRLNTKFGPPDSPSVMLQYVLKYESGETCQPAVVMVLVDASWRVGAYGPPCGDYSFPEGASSARNLSSPHELPRPTGENNISERPTGTLEREVNDSQIEEAIRLPARVVVGFIVDENGQPANLEVERGRHKSLDSMAVQSLRSTQFEPGRLNEEPVPTRMSVPVLFRSSNP